MSIMCPKCHADNPDSKLFCGDCGTQLMLPEEVSPSINKTLETPKTRLAVGSIFSVRYEVLEELGKVWLD
jgi:hypothetical protein